jgi:hypothetical protein
LDSPACTNKPQSAPKTSCDRYLGCRWCSRCRARNNGSCLLMVQDHCVTQLVDRIHKTPDLAVISQSRGLRGTPVRLSWERMATRTYRNGGPVECQCKKLGATGNDLHEFLLVLLKASGTKPLQHVGAVPGAHVGRQALQRSTAGRNAIRMRKRAFPSVVTILTTSSKYVCIMVACPSLASASPDREGSPDISGSMKTKNGSVS